MLFPLFRLRSPDKSSEPKGSWKCLTTYYGVRLPGISSPGPANSRLSCRSTSTKSAPPNLAKTSSNYPIRRHMQDDYKHVTTCFEDRSATDTDAYTWYE